MSLNLIKLPIPWLERHAWALDAARGFLSVTLGVFILSASRGPVVAAVFVAIGGYLVVDGCLDVALSWRARGTESQERTRWIAGLVSISAGVGAIVVHEAFLLILIVVFSVRSIIRGGIEIWRSVSYLWRRQRQTLSAGERFLWMGGLGRVALGAVIIAVSPWLLVVLLIAFGVYLIVDGLAAIYLATLKRERRGGVFTGASSFAPKDAEVPLTLSLRPDALRAIVFVRRSGANGLGHVAWAFEWQNGWFNAGSVENPSGAPIAPVDKMGGWMAHTRDLTATMIRQIVPYDEFKVLFVVKPHFISAWRTAVWVSRMPYSAQRRNCVDDVYDVLRAYGAGTLLDPAQRSIPNEWYDAIPGPSYRIVDHPEIPVRLSRVAGSSERRLRDIPLEISPRALASEPAWRATGGRAWYELRTLLEIVNEEVLQTASAASKQARALIQRLRIMWKRLRAKPGKARRKVW